MPWPQVGQIITRVFVKGDRPEVPLEVEEDVPAYVALMRRCWATLPADRPSAAEVVAALAALAEGLPGR